MGPATNKTPGQGVCSKLPGRQHSSSVVSLFWRNQPHPMWTKKQRHHFADKDQYSQSYDFSSSHVQMWELDCKEGWVPKNWCFWTAVLEKTLESPLDCKEIKLVNPKGNQPWIFIRKTDAEAEAEIIWPPDAKGQLTGKDPGAGKEGRAEGRRGQQRIR